MIEDLLEQLELKANEGRLEQPVSQGPVEHLEYKDLLEQEVPEGQLVPQVPQDRGDLPDQPVLPEFEVLPVRLVALVLPGIQGQLEVWDNQDCEVCGYVAWSLFIV